MGKIKSFWKKPTDTFELILSKDIDWIKVLFLFSCNGIIFIYYIMKTKRDAVVKLLMWEIGKSLPDSQKRV